jgi:hypothetical protein
MSRVLKEGKEGRTALAANTEGINRGLLFPFPLDSRSLFRVIASTGVLDDDGIGGERKEGMLGERRVGDAR